MKKIFASLIILSIFKNASPAYAAEVSSVDLNITGTIVANTTCTFSAGDSVEVKFGNVEFESVGDRKLIKGDYRQTLNANMTCKDYAGQALQMTLKSVDGNIIQYQGHSILPATVNNKSAGDDLAIRLLVDDQVKDFNSSFAVDVEAQPNIEVELVQTGDGASFFNGANITAGAVLLLEFL